MPVGGPIATTGDISVDDLPSSHGTITMFDLVSAVVLTGSVQYAAIVNQGDADGDISVALNSSDSFAGGTYVKSEDEGSSWSLDGGKDVAFQVFGFKAGATLTGRTAQQFLATKLGTLKTVSLALFTDAAATTGTIRVEIFDDVNGDPGDTLHGYFDIDVTSLPVGATGIFVGYVPTAVKNLAGNKKYWLSFKNTVLPDAKVFSETAPTARFPQEHKVYFD